MNSQVSQENELEWFPMRVTYNREQKVKKYLDELSIENFLPMRFGLVETATGRKRTLVPAIHNLIFVRSTQKTLSLLKMTKKDLAPLRYMTKDAEGGTGKVIIRVPNVQMENFIRVASVEDDTIMYLDYNKFISKVGRKVLITEGRFGGLEGVVNRIKKNKCVVVQIDGVAAVAITFVPPAFLRFID